MINKIKNMVGKVMILSLVMMMVIPTTVFADVDMWKDYKENVTTGILNQQEKITITFNGSESFTTEYAARLTIANAYEEAKTKMPDIYSGLNIVSETTGVVLNEKLQLTSVTHMITYKNDNKDFLDIKKILEDKYTTIKTKVTDYEKIEAAYNYVVIELSEPGDDLRNISDILLKQGNNAHAVLFSMMMIELGYDNDIVGTIREKEAKWNIVKVQGKWYHVNATVVNNFLTVNKGSDWDEEKHKGKFFAIEDYDGNIPTLPQLKYEIELINLEIDKTVAEIVEISKEIANISEGISIEKIREIKMKFGDIEEKVKNYKERKNILESEAKKLVLESQIEFGVLETRIYGITSTIIAKKDEIVDKAVTEAETTFKLADILSAKEAITMSEKKELLEQKMNALEVAVVAIIKAEQSKLDVDITLAKITVNNESISHLKAKLEVKIKVLEATIEVERAEKTMISEDVAMAADLVSTLEFGETKTSLENRLNAINAELIAKEAVDSAEQALKNNNTIEVIEFKISDAELKIEVVKIGSVKIQLQNRINDVKSAIVAVKSVNISKTSIDTIPEVGPLTVIIITAEANIKTAETEAKKIKDTNVRTTQQNRIKDIKLVIAAIKAVDKAETVKNTTNAKAAQTAINKIIKTEYDDIKKKLNSRMAIIDNSIKFIDSEKLIEKVETSLNRSDYEKAKAAIEKLDITQGKGLELENRRKDINDVIKAKESVENAEKLMKANKEKVGKYDAIVKEADGVYKIVDKKYDENHSEYEKYQAKYGDIIKNLKNRIVEMQAAITAIQEVDKAETIYNAYLISSGYENEQALVAAITAAEDSMKKINEKNTNISSINKSLLSRLKIFSDGLTADVDYNKVSNLLSDIEKALIKEGKELEKSIEELERQILGIVELSKNVKVQSSSKDLKDRVTAINDVIAATKAVVQAEGRDEKTISKDITASTKAVDKLSVTGIHKKIKDINVYKGNLKGRIYDLVKEVETSTNESKAAILVDKAISSKKETDIKLAIEAVSKLVDGDTKTGLNTKVEGMVIQLISNAETAILKVITSIERNDKSVSTNVSEAKKAVILAENVVLLADAKLQTIENGSYKTKYNPNINDLNENIKVIDISVVALNAVQQAEKTKKQEDVDIAKTAIERISTDTKYTSMKKELTERMDTIQKNLTDEAGIVKIAEDLVKAEEAKMKVESNPDSADLRTAQDAVNKVTDKTKKADLQKKIDAMNIAIASKSAVERAEAYTDTTSVKAAEKALDNLVKTNLYSDIVKSLSMRIGALNKELNITERVAEAANLVQKAVESRKQNDITIARDAVEGIEELDNPDDPKNPYKSLKDRLDALEESIKKEESGESTALGTAQGELLEVTKVIETVNTDIAKIIAGEVTEKDDIQNAYGKIQVAKNHVIAANAAIRRLNDQNQQKDLLKEIDYANKEIDLAEDKIDVKEAVRLVTIASSSVTTAKDELQKSKSKLDIAAARRAIDKIGHNDNKAIKVTILNTINSIEKKLTSDNDQELIDAAVDAVNDAANMLSEAVKYDRIKDKEEQEKIDKAIFAARMAIGWISDNNKAAKDTLTGFLDDIAAMFAAEKDGIENEKKIDNAEKAVKLAEGNKESDQLEGFIRSARLRVKMIKNDSLETEVIINDLNARLDVLEGKGSGGNAGTGGGSGSGGNNGNNKPGGGSSGSNKPGGGSSTGNTVPTTPLSDNDRFTGTTEPLWGKTNELTKKNPVTGISAQDMSRIRINESKLKIIELSNILKTTKSVNVKLIVRGKNINLDSKPYIHDKTNNSILVPIKFLGDEFGFTVSLIDSPVTNGAKRLLLNGIVDGKPKSIIMDFGSEYCYVDGNLVKMSSKPVIQGGRTYVPVDLIVEHFGLTFSYYNDGKSMQLIIN